MVEATGELNTLSILKVPIAKIGAWAHPTYGTVEFTEDDFNAALVNFNAGALGFEPHLTFGHLDEEPNSTDSARNRGGMKNLVREGEGGSELNGYFAVPPNTSQIVKEGGYTHASGEFIRNLMDKTSGKARGMAVSRVALTNTPYLPWGEEGKVQLLSHNGTVPLDMVNSVVKLSSTSIPVTDAPAVQVLDKVEGIEDMTASTIEQAPSVVVPPEMAPVITSVTSPAVVAPALDVDALTASIMTKMRLALDTAQAEKDAQAKVELDRIQAEKDAAVAESKAMVAALEAKMTGMADRLAKAESDASLYTNHASRAAQEVESQQLMSMGASAAIVNRYSAIRNALESKATTVKLSQGGVENESSLMDSIRDLLIGALQQTPVVTTQMGLAGVSNNEEGGVKGFLENIALENRKKATSVAI
jgi:hypothetical protein